LRFDTQLAGKVRIGRDVEGLHHVSFTGSNAVGRGTIFAGEVAVGYGTTIGPNCFLHGPVAIGNYCQFAPAVGIYGRDHPTSHISTYVNRNLLDGKLWSYGRAETVCIEHDVWVGHGAVILRGVRIGSGAVVAAGAVVTRSVPPYAIVAGNPARTLRMRFPDAVVERLLRLQWWFLGSDQLKAHEKLFEIDFSRQPDQAIALLDEALASLAPAGKGPEFAGRTDAIGSRL
jgi:acetyltransferase-like isoleucine patch superfamily enzyme